MAMSKPKAMTFLYSSHSSLSPSFLSLHFSSSPYPHHSSSSSSSYYPSRRHEEESRNVRVSVWWDFENCHIPAGVNVFRVAHSITAAVRANGIKGPIQITAFGDFLQLSRSNQEAMSSTGINLAHIPNGGKNSADRSLLVDLMYWVSQNPPPAHLFLISGDRDFACILHRLRMNNYNILLASTETAPSVLCSAASIMWHWNALLKGESLTGKHFNQPPDGPYGSWYGHSKVPLEDPFSEIEQPVCSRVEESPAPNSDVKVRPIPKITCSCVEKSPAPNSDVKVRPMSKIACSRVEESSAPSSDVKVHPIPHVEESSAAPSSDVNVRPIPKIIMKQIRHILNSCPKGIYITELRAELNRSNVGLEKDLYGYKKFSRFLLAMPHILKVQSGGNGQHIVHGVASKFPEHVESGLCKSSVPVSNNGHHDITISPKEKDVASSISKSANGKAHAAASVEEPPRNVNEPPPLGKVVAETSNACSDEDLILSVGEQRSAFEGGFFNKIWRNWFNSNDSDSGRKSQGMEEEYSSSGDSYEKIKSEQKNLKLTSQCADPVQPALPSSPSNESDPANNTASTLKERSDRSKTSGYFSWIFNWFNVDTSEDQLGERLNQINVHSGKHDIFSNDTFWVDMESFIATPKGSGIISHSKTRLHMAQNLQKDGPLVLRHLTENVLLHLVDLLILEKEWVKECPSPTSPFKLTQRIAKNYCLSDPSGSNGLISIFQGTPSSQPDSKILPDHEHQREQRYQNIPHSGVSSTAINQKPLDRPRSEILANCQNLVDEILKEHPDGYNMGSFRKLFAERYGYCLDVQKLGYQKLASLLLIMPGVKIESAFIMPSGKVSKGSSLEKAVSNSDCELHKPSRTDDHFDSPWEELGPVEDSTSSRNKIEPGFIKEAKAKKIKEVHHEYEPSLSDDDFSDSEEEGSSLSKPNGQEKPRNNEEDSSLLQILDSWYSSKDETSKRDGSENVDSTIDCSKNAVKETGSVGVGIKTEASAVNHGRKQRPKNIYSFVSDSGGDNKDKLIDGILGSLKMSGESRLQS